MPSDFLWQSSTLCCPQGTANNRAGDSTFPIISMLGTVGTVGTANSPYVIEIHTDQQPNSLYCNPYIIFSNTVPTVPTVPILYLYNIILIILYRYRNAIVSIWGQ